MIKTKAATIDIVSERELRNKELSYEAAVEGIVLLENDGTLPISAQKLALFGAGSEYTIAGGSGSGEVNTRHNISVLEGLEMAGIEITTKDWIQRYDTAWKEGKASFIKEMRRKLFRPGVDLMTEIMAAEYRYPFGEKISEEEISASDTDTCVYVLSRQSGEGADRKDEAGSFRLDETEIENIRICAKLYPKFVFVINSGAPIDLSPLEEISGINAGGRALADVLTGKRTPSGKLAVSWPKNYSDIPFGEEFGSLSKDPAHAAYKEGIYVGYRYYDSFDVEPRYPFGYGKGYTDFEIETKKLELHEKNVHVQVLVRNKGKLYSGREIVQIYVSCPKGKAEKEYQRLTGFAKTGELAPGEEEELSVSFPLAYLSSYDEKTAQTLLDSGDYIIRIGNCSAETKATAILRLENSVVLSQHKNLCKAERHVTVLTGTKEQSIDGKEMLPVIQIPVDLFQTKNFNYEDQIESFSGKTEKHLEELSPEEMIQFCAGTGMFGKQEGFYVPGSAGHTTSAFQSRGIPNAEMCDGPAGLRIQPRSVQYKNGQIKSVDLAISMYEILPGFINKYMIGNPKKGQMLYQFVTGFPVAAAVAQSWNTDLAEKIGEAVSTEMTEFGVTFWLAPGMNIVRNPLCGRNFEYYSEDPVLTGKMAAAVTRGVQKTPGNYVTIKHFAANNQETNRQHVSSDLDERSLREIYLKGFEIAVKEAAPKSVMSAYNLINGVYCPNSGELCTEILRNEWGFEGVVMTDWFATGKTRADDVQAILSGVDIIMPGGKGVISALKKGLKSGSLSKVTVRKSCGRVLELILDARPK